MKHATSRELYDYWNRVRAGAAAPRRSDIEPGAIRRILADTFILEVAERGAYPIRLAGTGICGAYGREIKGDDFMGLWSAEDRDAIATLGTAVATDAAVAVISVRARTARERSVPCEMLILPLRHGSDSYDRILGSFAPLEQPYWLGSETIADQRITSLRLIWPDEQPRFLRRSTGRMAERKPVPIPFPVPNRRRRGHLTVLDGGKS